MEAVDLLAQVEAAAETDDERDEVGKYLHEDAVADGVQRSCPCGLPGFYTPMNEVLNVFFPEYGRDIVH